MLCHTHLNLLMLFGVAQGIFVGRKYCAVQGLSYRPKRQNLRLQMHTINSQTKSDISHTYCVLHLCMGMPKCCVLLRCHKISSCKPHDILLVPNLLVRTWASNFSCRVIITAIASAKKHFFFGLWGFATSIHNLLNFVKPI